MGVGERLALLSGTVATFPFATSAQQRPRKIPRIGIIDDSDTRNVFAQRQYAGNLVALQRIPGASGVSWGEALAMITSRPAEVLGLGREIGSLAPGRRADVVIWSGDPLQVTSNADAVFIDGVQQPLDTRQTKLRERYKDLCREVLPEAYQR